MASASAILSKIMSWFPLYITLLPSDEDVNSDDALVSPARNVSALIVRPGFFTQLTSWKALASTASSSGRQASGDDSAAALACAPA